MVTLAEILILKYALEKLIISREELEEAQDWAENQQTSLKEALIQRGFLTSSQWKSCLKEVQFLPLWPENISQRNLDNQMIFQRLKSSGRVSESALKEAIALCQRLANPEHSPRLHEILLSKGFIREGEVALYLGIEKNRLLGCPSCRFSLVLSQYYPWKKYPCPFCQGHLAKSHQTQHSSVGLTREQPALTTQGSNFKTFGRYKILEKLGEGGMGAVYKAHDSLLQRTVALKIIRQDVKDESALKRFQQEMNLAANLHHPFIVPLYELGEEEGTPFYTMAFIEGESLREYVGSSKISQKEALEMMEKVSRAVFYAHEQGVIHRDLKPDNIMIDEDGLPYLMDFGLAKNIKREDTRLTKTGNIVGSPEFMAPEQATGEKKLTFSVDIYALGGILFYMVTGRPPFSGGEVMQLLHKVVNKAPPSPCTFNRLVQKDVETMVLKCLAKNPQDRYDHAGLLLHDIRCVRKGRPITGQAPGLWNFLRHWMGEHKKAAGGLILAFGLFLLLLFLWIQTMRSKMKTEGNLSALRKKEKKLHREIVEKKNQLRKKTAQISRARRALALKKSLFQKEMKKLLDEKKSLEGQMKKIRRAYDRRAKKFNRIKKDRLVEAKVAASNQAQKMGNPLRAIAILKEGLKINHRQNLLYSNIAVIYYRMGKMDKTYQMLQKSADFGSFPEQVHSLVQVCFRLQKWREAKVHINYFIAHYPKHGLIGEVYLMQGKISQGENKIDQAIGIFQKGLKTIDSLHLVSHKKIPFYTELGNCYKGQKKWRKAREAFKIVLSFKDGRYQSFYNYARQQILLLKGR